MASVLSLLAYFCLVNPAAAYRAYKEDPKALASGDCLCRSISNVLSFPLCQMLMTTRQDCLGSLPHPLVKTWHRPHRCPTAAATWAWPLAGRRREGPACPTPVSSVINPSGMTRTHVSVDRKRNVLSDCLLGSPSFS